MNIHDISVIDSYTDADGVERCGNCNDTMDECVCACSDCGDHVTECACDDGPSYPTVADWEQS